MARAEYVDIDENRLAAYATGLQRVEPTSTRPDPGPGPGPDPEATALLVLALDAINFGSGYHDVIRKRPDPTGTGTLSGSQTMSAALSEYAVWTGSLHAARLRRITIGDCSQIFGQELDGGASEELMGRFATALNDLGTFLHHGDGTALAVLDAADGSAVRLAEALTAMPFYRDVEELDGREVAFYKRAQISAADLGRRLPEVCNFIDEDRLTAFADNLVPHVLRIDGVLVYRPELADVIDRRELLPPGERAEIEIRAAGVHVVELLSAYTGHRAMDIDEWLWSRGGGADYKAVPRHRARSVFY